MRVSSIAKRAGKPASPFCANPFLLKADDDDIALRSASLSRSRVFAGPLLPAVSIAFFRKDEYQPDSCSQEKPAAPPEIDNWNDPKNSSYLTKVLLCRGIFWVDGE
jgi:hypothetical protein